MEGEPVTGEQDPAAGEPPQEITFSGGATLRPIGGEAPGGQRYAGWYRPPSGADAGLAFPPDEIAWLGIPDGD